MKKVSIQDLKATLSAVVAEAEAGAIIVVTRHNEPVARLVPAAVADVHRGARVGSGRLEPALRRNTKGRYLTVLLDDRGNGERRTGGAARAAAPLPRHLGLALDPAG